MIIYTPFDFFIQSLLIGLVNLCFYGVLAVALFLFTYWRYDRRMRRQEQDSRVIYPREWHRPNPLEEA